MFRSALQICIIAGLLCLPILRAETAKSPLADAAEASDQSAVRALIKQHADADAPQPDGMTALHWAARHDDAVLARELLKAGANAKSTNNYGVTALSLACINGNGEIVNLLLNAGADANAALRGGETPLMTAARTGKVGPIKALLAHSAVVDAKEHRGQTALMWASAEGNEEAVDALLKAGADLNASLADSGFTPLFFAVREGRINVVRRLLKAGADVNTTMQPARSSGKGPVKGMSPLLLAVENGHFELADALLEAGADPNDQRSGFTALHALTWVRKPNVGDGDDGDPAPNGSGRMSSLQFVNKLVSHGARLDTRLEKGKTGRGILTRKGATPFLMASATADIAYMRLLVKFGADPAIPNAEHATPLMAAAGVGCLAPTEEAGTEAEALEAVQYCLSLGADINAVDDNGETAMHGAAYKSLPLVVKFLSSHGAKIETWNHKNRWGWTPMRIAEGYRVGNFKPSFETIAAIREVMQSAGLEVPEYQSFSTDSNITHPAEGPSPKGR